MWCVKLSDSQRDALRALAREQHERGPALTAALEALDLARWDDLPEATLPWEQVADLAERVASYKRVHEVHFVERLPRTPAGKLLRRELQPSYV